MFAPWRRVVRRRRDHVEQVGRGLVVVLEDPVALALRAGEGPQLDDLAFGPLAVAPIMQEVKPIKI